MTANLEQLRSRQTEFQKFVGFPVESSLEKDRNDMSEKYVFKLIEEAIEFRKEFPSSINPWSKHQKFADETRLKEEFSDILLFAINIANLWKFSTEDMLEVLKQTQINNFLKVKVKKMNVLTKVLLKIPGYTVGIGRGNLFPKYIMIGQNPGKGISHGYKVWSDSSSGSSKLLLPALEKMQVLKDCYFTNLVKSTTENNRVPTDEEVEFWMPYFMKELAILKAGNDNLIKVIALGNFVAIEIAKLNLNLDVIKILHPSSALRSHCDVDLYIKSIKQSWLFTS